MKFDTEHLHYWMQAIRQSNNPMRTLDAFWSGQLNSKEWLIDNIRPFITTPSSIEIHGGWVGLLASMIFQSDIPVTTIRSIDIDPHVEHVANMMNRKEELENRFVAVTSDMCKVVTTANVVINTSCEHITQDQYDRWLDQVSNNSIIVLQSNDYNIPEHIRCVSSIDDFVSQSKIKTMYKGELALPTYTRYMIIGTK
jgi:hypothetical protein